MAPMSDPQAPLNPLPAIAWVLTLPMLALEIVLSAGEQGIAGGPAGIGWRAEAIQTLAFSPDYLRQMLILGQYPADGLWRPFTHVFVNPDLTGALFSLAMTLALAKFTGEIFRFWAVLILFLIPSAVGALAYAAIPYTHAALIGGWPGVYGLIGGFTYVQWMRARLTGQPNNAFRLIGFLLGLRLVFGMAALATGGLDQSEGWMWVSEAAAFAAGFGLSFGLIPGGAQEILSRLRKR